MKTALDTLADLSGLNRATMNELLQQVQANHARLNGCPRHDFAPIPPLQVSHQKYRCACCGGEVDRSAWYWHEQGRRPG